MSMSDRDGFIWYDGKLVPWRDATTHVLTHTLHYGMGVFEGLRAYRAVKGTAIFRLQEHTDRLFNSAHIFQMRMPYDKATIMEAQLEVVRANKLESCYIRPICFYGSEAMGIAAKTLSTHVAIAAWPWGAYLGDDGMEKGIRVKTSSFTRHHVNVNMCRAKSVTTYTNSILAHQEADNDNYDEALLLDLEGITRDSVFTLAAEMGIEIFEKRITRDEVYCADEAFFTGTAAEVTPIRELDHRTIGSGSRGPITARLQQAFFDCVAGKHPQHAGWLSYI